jgi:ribosomal protein L23
MALFDFFKQKKKEGEQGEKKKETVKAEKVKKIEKREKAEKSGEIIYSKKEKKEIITAPVILRSPHIAEKSSHLAKMNQYIFKVYPRVNKIEIKKAVEEVYGVDVLKIKMITIPKKQVRIGKTFGWKKEYKKAIVLVKKGQSIEISPR